MLQILQIVRRFGNSLLFIFGMVFEKILSKNKEKEQLNKQLQYQIKNAEDFQKRQKERDNESIDSIRDKLREYDR